jgi:hypothetical protein
MRTGEEDAKSVTSRAELLREGTDAAAWASGLRAIEFDSREPSRGPLAKKLLDCIPCELASKNSTAGLLGDSSS